MVNLGDGKYNFVSANTRVMYTTAHAALSQLELWEFIKKGPGPNGFTFSSAPQLTEIYKKIEDLGYYGHSGYSFGSIMRTMQFIAINGYARFKVEYLQAN